MTSRFFVLFAACFAMTAAANMSLDPQAIQEVFGRGGYAPPPPSPPQQAVPVTPGPPKQAVPVTPAPPALPPDDIFSPAASDYDQFDWTLTKRVAAVSDKNFLVSPLGLKLALAILTEAATGVTQNELSSVLGFDLDRNLVRSKFSTIIESLQKESPYYILNLGSRIYVGDNTHPRQRFAAIAQEFYKTELKNVNFNNPAVASKEINTWVSNITQGHIPSLVNEDDVANMVVLVLNTLYFKGSWYHQFPPNATHFGKFNVSPLLVSYVEYMNVNAKFFYTESTKYDAKILRMPYLGNKYAMYIIVPNSLMGLPRVLTDIGGLRQELENLQEYTVDVTLPRFQFDQTSQLDGILRELGIRAAFEETASFPGIARGQEMDQRLKVSKVLQRAGIVVNELGSIAYSATEISLVNKFGEDIEATAEVVADKPFLFFIQDEATRQLLFTGRVSEPHGQDGILKV